MRLLYANGAFAPIPVKDGFVFIAQQPLPEPQMPAEPAESGEETAEETAAPAKMTVGYKMYRFRENTVEPVTRSVYLLSKFGINYETYQHDYKRYLPCRILFLSAKQQLVIEPSGQARIVSSGDQVSWVGDLCFENEAPAGAFLHGNALWLTYTGRGAVAKYDVRSMLRELRIGGGQGERFAAPEGIWADDTCALICSGGENRIVRLALDSFELSTYREFEEPVRGYFRVDQNEVVQLDSGFYVL